MRTEFGVNLYLIWNNYICSAFCKKAHKSTRKISGRVAINDTFGQLRTLKARSSAKDKGYCFSSNDAFLYNFAQSSDVSLSFGHSLVEIAPSSLHFQIVADSVNQNYYY